MWTGSPAPACWSMSQAIRLGLVPEMLPAERHLAEVCNRRDYSWRVKINCMLAKDMSLQEIAEKLNHQAVHLPICAQAQVSSGHVPHHPQTTIHSYMRIEERVSDIEPPIENRTNQVFPVALAKIGFRIRTRQCALSHGS
jgi:hypothetical protein